MSAIDKIAVLAEHHAHVNGSANLPIEYAAILELDERLRRIEGIKASGFPDEHGDEEVMYLRDVRQRPMDRKRIIELQLLETARATAEAEMPDLNPESKALRSWEGE